MRVLRGAMVADSWQTCAEEVVVAFSEVHPAVVFVTFYLLTVAALAFWSCTWLLFARTKSTSRIGCESELAQPSGVAGQKRDPVYAFGESPRSGNATERDVELGHTSQTACSQCAAACEVPLGVALTQVEEWQPLRPGAVADMLSLESAASNTSGVEV